MNETLKFAESELKKYTRQITDSKVAITLFCSEVEKKDIFYEHYTIDIKNGVGQIVGENPRSVLLGVYHFLRYIGVRFLRGGDNGEIIPHKQLSDLNCKLDFEPLYRHRGITIEGAVSLENVINMIDYGAKNGFNSYFLQFRNGYEFFERWYKHKSNPELKPQNFTVSDSSEYTNIIVSELKKRSMIYHAVGHGWTCESLGVKSLGWSNTDLILDDEKKNLLAKVNGKREFFKGVPLNTHLCYSNPLARELLINEVVTYAENHREIDVLHFWLADNYNNLCECDECVKKRLSDLYVEMLNEIDKRLTNLKLSVKICFCVYLELYWSPLKERIINTDRFILMFAPIFRSYTKTFSATAHTEQPELLFERNKMQYPSDNGPYIDFLKSWQKQFAGDSFDFDYHLMWDINRDFGGLTLSKVIYDDINALKGLGLNGFMSCQLQRAFYPNGLCMYMLAKTLYEPKTPYEEIVNDYYQSAFGKNAEFAKQVYNDISHNISFEYFKEEKTFNDVKSGFLKVCSLLENYLEEAQKLKGENSTEEKSLDLLKFLLQFLIRFVKIILIKGSKNSEQTEIDSLRNEFKSWFNSHEMENQSVYDGFYVNMITDGLIDSVKTGIFAV